MRRSLAVGALSAVLVGASAGPALAHSGDDDGGGFVPVETVIPEYYDPVEFEACGTTVRLESGDVREVEVRRITRPDGTQVTTFRGAATVDLIRADGARIDELDISGPGKEIVSPDGSHVVTLLFGASLIFPSPDPVDQAAFDEADLPDIGYFEHGAVTFDATVNPDTGELLALDIDVDARVVDLCRRFDRDDHGHGDGHGDGHDPGHGDGDGRHGD
ncbi:hypothetical protein [Geodermatophilus sp. URMC 64]